MSTALSPPVSSPRRPAWPVWYGPAAFALALVGSSFLVAIAVALGGWKTDTPGLTFAATLVQDLAFVAAAVVLAARVARPRAEDFGLRPARLKRALGVTVSAFVIYAVFQVLYVQIAGAPSEQTTLKDLGAGDSRLALVAVGVLVVGVAPAVEEFFFRGFFFGSLRSRLTALPAAFAAGAFFGLIHAPTGLDAVPPLVVLGIVFCLVYELTGSLFPAIALHAFNNMLAFGSSSLGDWAVAVTVAGALIALCTAMAVTSAAPSARAPRPSS